MSQEEEFLVVGAELKCPYGTVTGKLKEGKDCTSMQIRGRVFLPVQATKEGENIEGFGMCLSSKCLGGTIPCAERMLLASEWINPVKLNSILMIQGEEAIHRNAQLICVSGQASIQALTTGQDEPTESEKKFYQYMREMFGFDDDVIAIMLKVIYAIDEAYPKESERKKAWRFARLMGGFSYGFGEENRFIEIRNEEKMKNEKKKEVVEVDDTKIWIDILKWSATAGAYKDINEKMSEKDYFVKELNLSEYEYYKLRFHVMAQHEITSRPANCFPEYMTVGVGGYTHPYHEVWESFFEKFDSKENFAAEWDRLYKKYVNAPEDVCEELSNQYMLFSEYGTIGSAVEDYLEDSLIEPNYSDFSHQQILTATITLDGITADTLAGVSAQGMAIVHLPAGFLSSPWLGIDVAELTHSYRTSLAGWLGDIRLADSKLSEDDYKADLDGLNVSNLIIKEDFNTIDAINEYYGALENGTTTREKEFLSNMGGGNAEVGFNITKILDGLYSSPSHIMGKEAAGDEISEEFMNRIAVGLE